MPRELDLNNIESIEEAIQYTRESLDNKWTLKAVNRGSSTLARCALCREYYYCCDCPLDRHATTILKQAYAMNHKCVDTYRTYITHRKALIDDACNEKPAIPQAKAMRKELFDVIRWLRKHLKKLNAKREERKK